MFPLGLQSGNWILFFSLSPLSDKFFLLQHAARGAALQLLAKKEPLLPPLVLWMFDSGRAKLLWRGGRRESLGILPPLTGPTPRRTCPWLGNQFHFGMFITLNDNQFLLYYIKKKYGARSLSFREIWCPNNQVATSPYLRERVLNPLPPPVAFHPDLCLELMEQWRRGGELRFIRGKKRGVQYW